VAEAVVEALVARKVGDPGLPGDRERGDVLASPVPSLASPPASSSQLRVRIVAALESCEGNVSAASRELGVHRNQLRRWLDRHGIEPPTFGPGGEE